MVLITCILYAVILVAIFQFNILVHKQADGIDIWATTNYCPLPHVEAVKILNVTNLTNGTKLYY